MNDAKFRGIFFAFKDLRLPRILKFLETWAENSNDFLASSFTIIETFTEAANNNILKLSAMCTPLEHSEWRQNCSIIAWMCIVLIQIAESVLKAVEHAHTALIEAQKMKRIITYKSEAVFMVFIQLCGIHIRSACMRAFIMQPPIKRKFYHSDSSCDCWEEIYILHWETFLNNSDE